MAVCTSVRSHANSSARLRSGASHGSGASHASGASHGPGPSHAQEDGTRGRRRGSRSHEGILTELCEDTLRRPDSVHTPHTHVHVYTDVYCTHTPRSHEGVFKEPEVRHGAGPRRARDRHRRGGQHLRASHKSGPSQGHGAGRGRAGPRRARDRHRRGGQHLNAVRGVLVLVQRQTTSRC